MNIHTRNKLRKAFHHKLLTPLHKIRRFKREIFIREPHWVRKVKNLHIGEFISNFNTQKLDAVEISGTGK
jgi:hypothetical protein